MISSVSFQDVPMNVHLHAESFFKFFFWVVVHSFKGSVHYNIVLCCSTGISITFWRNSTQLIAFPVKVGVNPSLKKGNVASYTSHY